jgi:hypothetical protein
MASGVHSFPLLIIAGIQSEISKDDIPNVTSLDTFK